MQGRPLGTSYSSPPPSYYEWKKTLKPRESQGHIKVTEKQSVGWRSWFGVTYRQSFVVAKYVTLSHSLNVVVLLSDISMYPKFREFMMLSQPLDLRV